jgi:hypothetical protein
MHGDSFRDRFGRSLDRSEIQFSIGFQPVFYSCHRTEAAQILGIRASTFIGRTFILYYLLSSGDLRFKILIREAVQEG